MNNELTPIIERLHMISQAVLMALLMFCFGRMLHALRDARKLAIRTWQKAITDFIFATLGAAGIIALMILWTGV